MAAVMVTSAAGSLCEAELMPSLDKQWMDKRRSIQVVTIEDDRQGSDSVSPLSVPDSNTATLIRLLAQLLHKDESKIAPSDNFFSLGCDSLVAMQLVSKLRETGVSLTVKEVMANPILSEMSQSMRKLLPTVRRYRPYCMIKGRSERQTLLQQAVSKCHVNRDDIEDILPSTPLQEGLLALSFQQSDLYVSREIFELVKDTDVQRLKEACNAVIGKTGMLRTRFFQSDDNRVMQVITKCSADCDLSMMSLEEYLAADKRPRSEAYGITNRFGIVQDSEGKLFIVWTVHHAIADGYSMRRMFENIEDTYNGKNARVSQPFGVFVQQLSLLPSEASHEFWKTHLAGALAPNYPAMIDVGYRCVARSIAVRRIALAMPPLFPFTYATVLRTAWALLMSKYENSNDVVFGTISNGRNVPVAGIENIIGPTFAALPVRIRYSESMTIESLLQKVQTQTVDVIPFEQVGLQAISALSTETKQACDFRTMLIMQDGELEARHGNDTFIKYDTYQSEKSLSYPITLSCNRKGDTVTAEMIYDSSLVQELQAERLLRQLNHIIQQLLLSAFFKRPLNQISYVNNDDEAEILRINKPLMSTRTMPIHEMVHEQVLRQPLAEAVCSQDISLTYEQLAEYSDNLSLRIRQLIKSPGPFRAVLCLEKSAWAVVSYLAVLKAGGTCVPIAFEEPSDRAKEILSSTKAPIVLASPYYSSSFLSLAPHVLMINTANMKRLEKSNLSQEKVSLPPVSVDIEALIIHTSGSTGKPKGVVQDHRSLGTALQHIRQRLSYSETMRHLQFAAFTFDLSFGQMFTTLMAGGCVCVPSESDRVNNLAGVINSLKVNYASLTPTVSRLFGPSEVPKLKHLHLGGEGPRPQDITRWADHLNLEVTYGPSECGIDCIGTEILTSNAPSAVIGTPFSCAAWFTLPDDHDRLAPPGAIAELLLEGPVVGRGYLNQPNVTAAAFITSPAWAKSIPPSSVSEPRRFYKTGDLVVLEPTGDIRYVGRKDFQIKLHGQRIELGEIEHQLLKCLPDGSEVVVEVSSKHEHGSESVITRERLIAFYSIPGMDEDQDAMDFQV